MSLASIIQRLRPRPCQWLWVTVKRGNRVYRVRQCVVHTPTPPPIHVPPPSAMPIQYATPPPSQGVPMCPASMQPVFVNGQWQCVPLGVPPNVSEVPPPKQPPSSTVIPKMPTMNNTMALKYFFNL